MKKNEKIKVVKKNDVKIVKTPVIIEKNSKQQSTEMASTVSGWVDEFHQRTLEEKKQAIAQFYS